jgi:undecaprenyl-diphosphatase
MTLLEAIALGIVQGLTEFLPVSSSGHLVIMQQIFGLKASSEVLLGFDLALHFGTLISVVLVFHRDLLAMARGLWLLLRRPAETRLSKNNGAYLDLLVIIGTIPAVVAALAFKDFFRGLFASALTAAVMLLVTGGVLWLTRYARALERRLTQLTGRDALLVGIAQAVAIFPGISRSGMTISAALFQGWDRALAARFSFLLAVPAILGGIVFELDGLRDWSAQAFWPLVAGVIAATISGFIAIHWLLRVVQRGRLHHFAYYCWTVGLAALLWFGLFH